VKEEFPFLVTKMSPLFLTVNFNREVFKMKMPDFTAQASLYRSNSSYRSPTFDGASMQRPVVVPQRGGRGFEGHAFCIDTCRDRGGTEASCRRICNGGDPPKVPGTYGPSCDVDPPSSCLAYLSGCFVALPGSPVILPICLDYYEQCLEDSRRECQGGLKTRTETTRLKEMNTWTFAL
jgi:hypothetical protein